MNNNRNFTTVELTYKYEDKQAVFKFDHFPSIVEHDGLRLEIQAIDSYKIIDTLIEKVLEDRTIIQKPFTGVARKINFPINLN